MKFLQRPSTLVVDALRGRVGSREVLLLSHESFGVSLDVRLTPAESAIVDSIVDGRSYRRIAEERGRSPRTVANQVQSLYERLGIKSRVQLLAVLTRLKK